MTTGTSNGNIGGLLSLSCGELETVTAAVLGEWLVLTENLVYAMGRDGELPA